MVVTVLVGALVRRPFNFLRRLQINFKQFHVSSKQSVARVLQLYTCPEPPQLCRHHRRTSPNSPIRKSFQNHPHLGRDGPTSVRLRPTTTTLRQPKPELLPIFLLRTACLRHHNPLPSLLRRRTIECLHRRRLQWWLQSTRCQRAHGRKRRPANRMARSIWNRRV